MNQANRLNRAWILRGMCLPESLLSQRKLWALGKILMVSHTSVCTQGWIRWCLRPLDPPFRPLCRACHSHRLPPAKHRLSYLPLRLCLGTVFQEPGFRTRLQSSMVYVTKNFVNLLWLRKVCDSFQYWCVAFITRPVFFTHSANWPKQLIWHYEGKELDGQNLKWENQKIFKIEETRPDY